MPRSLRALTYIDFAVCIALALPFVSPFFFGLIGHISGALNLGSVPAPSGPAAFFVNLAGLFGVLWNIGMLQEEPRELHHSDLLGRLGVIALLVYHILLSGLSVVFGVFIVTELLGGVIKWRWLNARTR